MSRASLTDLYEVTMALSYLDEDMRAPATFSLAVRDLPPDRGFLVAAGLEPALDYLSDFRVEPEDVDAFATALNQPRQDVAAMEGLEFTGEVRAIPEGRVVLAGEPLLEVTAPLPQAQLVETGLLNLISHQTAVASKAARCVLAARGRPVVDFSLRRTHGADAGMQAARLGGMVGFAFTSNVAAAASYGMPATGTMAHSYIEAFPSEEAAFRAFARTHPERLTLLVDTYDTEHGVTLAARVFHDLGISSGAAIRLDSGDLSALAKRSRRILDEAGLPNIRIIASGGLDEYTIDDLLRDGAPIDVFAVGTRVGVAADAPYLDSAYKLAQYDGHPVMKLSSKKITLPGTKQVYRRPGFSDTIALTSEPPPADGEPLLRTVMSGGRRTEKPASLSAAREHFEHDLARLPAAAKRIHDPTPPHATLSEPLRAASDRLRRDITARELDG